MGGVSATVGADCFDAVCTFSEGVVVVAVSALFSCVADEPLGTLSDALGVPAAVRAGEAAGAADLPIRAPMGSWLSPAVST